MPARWLPKWKSSPTTTTRTARPSISTRSTNDSGASAAWASSKRSTTTASMPVSASSSSRCSGLVRSAGADSGRTIVAGWRSNVRTTERAPSASALARTSAITAW